MKNKNKMTIIEGAAVITAAADKWIDGGTGTIYALTIRVARKLSKDPVFNAAAWMMYNFGPAMHGETAESFLHTVKDLVKILKG